MNPVTLSPVWMHVFFISYISLTTHHEPKHIPSTVSPSHAFAPWLLSFKPQSNLTQSALFITSFLFIFPHLTRPQHAAQLSKNSNLAAYSPCQNTSRCPKRACRPVHAVDTNTRARAHAPAKTNNNRQKQFQQPPTIDSGVLGRSEVCRAGGTSSLPHHRHCGVHCSSSF